MNPIATSLITLACIVGGMLLGMFLRTLELDQPHGGVIRISGEPLRSAIAQIGR